MKHQLYLVFQSTSVVIPSLTLAGFRTLLQCTYRVYKGITNLEQETFGPNFFVPVQNTIQSPSLGLGADLISATGRNTVESRWKGKKIIPFNIKHSRHQQCPQEIDGTKNCFLKNKQILKREFSEQERTKLMIKVYAGAQGIGKQGGEAFVSEIQLSK